MNPFETLVMGPLGATLVIAVVVWSAVWKLFALYRAGSRGHKGWFVALFFLNTVGILEIVYLFVVSRRSAGSQ